MKIAILSDTRLPTSPTYPGHGLGQIAHAQATGLTQRGHDVTLFAAPGSKFDGGKLMTANDEREFLSYDLSKYSAIIDNSHSHVTGVLSGFPAIQVSHDREARPTANAVFPSASHRDWHGFTETNSRVIHNGVPLPELPDLPVGDYVCYVSNFYPPKGAIAAVEAARLAGVRIIMAGTTPPAPPPGCEYVGTVSGQDKVNLLARAKALIFPSAIECAPVTVLEAQAARCPVIVSAYGGASENMLPDVTGYVCRDTLEMADAIGRVGKLKREDCRQWIADCRNVEQMVDGYERMLGELVNGARW